VWSRQGATTVPVRKSPAGDVQVVMTATWSTQWPRRAPSHAKVRPSPSLTYSFGFFQIFSGGRSVPFCAPTACFLRSETTLYFREKSAEKLGNIPVENTYSYGDPSKVGQASGGGQTKRVDKWIAAYDQAGKGGEAPKPGPLLEDCNECGPNKQYMLPKMVQRCLFPVFLP
jgi:hypothetical protein